MHFTDNGFTDNLPRYAGICVVGICLPALFGWLLDNQTLMGLGLGLSPMKFNSALAFACGGTSLLLEARTRQRPALPMLLAALTTLLGLLTLVEYGFGVNLRLDELFVADRGSGQSFPGRMAITTALAFVLNGSALCLWKAWRMFSPVRTLALIAWSIAWLSFAAYLYGGTTGGRFATYRPMTVSTTLAAFLLSLGILSLDKRHGLIAAFQRTGYSGSLARRLFPAAVAAPLLLGWLRLYGQRLGLYGTEFGLALLTTSTILILLVLIWTTTNSLALIEAAEGETKKELGRLSELIDYSNDAIITMDARRRVISWNRGAEELYGWATAEAKGKVIHQFLVTVSSVSTSDVDRILAETGRWDGELVHTRRDGKQVTVDSRQVLQRSESGEVSGILEINRDISDRKAIEAQLRQTQRLESVGQLAGGVAHDFNNILTVISGYADMLLNDPEVPPSAQDSVEEIATAADRAAGITRQLLAFSRHQISVRQNVVPNNIIAGMEKMLRRLIGEHILLVFCLDDTPVVISIDPGQLEQVIMNLAINARDAMAAGGSSGKIMIEASHILVDPEFSATHFGLTRGTYAVLSVSDTGIGMSAEVKARIFEPFFTTKEPGKGTGLGLSTVYGIVQQNKGTVLVYSEVGKGTTFKVLLPATDGPATQARSGASSVALKGTETILLVEDEEPLRNYVRRVLELNGYNVLVAIHGREALDVASKYHSSIDLLLTDIIMPEMGGKDLAEQFSKQYPGIAVLHMSGYTNRLWKLDAGINFIQKPFTATALLTEIRRIVESGSPPGVH